jgi:hypothetical protein
MAGDVHGMLVWVSQAYIHTPTSIILIINMELGQSEESVIVETLYITSIKLSTTTIIIEKKTVKSVFMSAL